MGIDDSDQPVLCAYSDQTESSLYSPVFKLIIQAIRLDTEAQADKYRPFSPTRFRFTSGDAIHRIRMLFTLFELPVVTSKTSLTTIFHYATICYAVNICQKLLLMALRIALMTA